MHTNSTLDSPKFSLPQIYSLLASATKETGRPIYGPAGHCFFAKYSVQIQCEPLRSLHCRQLLTSNAAVCPGAVSGQKVNTVCSAIFISIGSLGEERLCSFWSRHALTQTVSRFRDSQKDHLKGAEISNHRGSQPWDRSPQILLKKLEDSDTA